MRPLALLILLFSFTVPMLAQAPGPEIQQGMLPYGTFQDGAIDSVNLGNGNVVLHIPLIEYPQRGGKLRLSFKLFATNKSWRIYNNGVTQSYVIWGQPGLVWVGTDQGLRSKTTTSYWTDDFGHKYLIRSVSAIDADGASHEMIAQNTLRGTGTLYSADATGITSASGIGLTDRDGISYAGGTGFAKDSNGNQITYSSTSGWTDTIGRIIPGYGSAGGPDGSALSYAPGVATNTTNCPTGTASALLWTVPGPSGGSVSFKFCFANFSYQTHFNYYGVNEGAGTQSLLNAVVLPNLTKWVFTYDSYLNVSSIGFPEGGSISYTWTNLAPNPPSRVISSRTINAADGSGPHTWNYTWQNYGGTVVVTDPLLNDTVSKEVAGYVYETKTYSGSYTSGTLLKTVSTTYDESTGDPMAYYNVGTGQAVNVVPLSQTITWANGQTMQTTTSYDSGYQYSVTDFDDNVFYQNGYFGLPINETVSDYGQGAPGSILKQTSSLYYWQNNPNYLTANLLALPQTIQIKDASGNPCARTDYTYDSASYLTTSGISTQHVSPPGPVRGNLSSVTRQLASSSSPCSANPSWTAIPSYTNAYDTGTLYKAIDPLTHTTTYAYSTTFAGAYPTTVTNALSQSTTLNYDFNTGLLTSVKDPNLLQTSYTYDNMFRIASVTRPDGGSASITRQESSPPFTATLTSMITSSLSSVAKNTFDGLGRPYQSQLTSDPQGTTFTATTYDALGRKYQVYNPTRCNPPTSNCGEATWGRSSFGYDALSRSNQVTDQDGSIATVSYAGNCTTATDEAGKSRTSCVDGLGRVTAVWEDPGASPHLNYETDYTYDVLGNLLTVTQKGGTTDSSQWRTRTFTYDSLSRLLTASNPESGTISYAYDNAGNLYTKTAPKPNQTGSLTVVTTYTYDAANRLTQKSYSDGTTPTVKYGYDAVAPSGCTLPTLTINNGIGKRTGMCDAAGAEAWSYDITSGIGWKITDARTTNSISKTSIYQSNFDGSTSTITYPSARVLTYTVGGAGRLLTAKDVANNINYATAALYTPPGSLASLTNGASVLSTLFYNSRLQPCRISVKNTGTAPTSCTDTATGNILDFTYGFNLGSTDNGNVVSITNNRVTPRSQTFSYDALNRIQLAETTSTYATSPANCWGEQFTIDAWGNLTNTASPSSSYTGCVQESSLNLAATTKNQVTGYTYDAAGNLTNIPATGASFTYDAENHLLTTAGITYTYDGDGRRVKKSNGKLYWYGTGSDTLDETDLSGNTNNSSFKEFVFFNGKRVASRDYSGNVNYYLADHLGTARVVTNSAGSVPPLDDSDFYPFGGERVVTSSSGNTYKFTGKERDSESGLDNFGFRYLTSSMGRFMSPDSIANDWELANPQTWNRYAYARNNPLIYVDPDGAAVELICTGGNADQCAAQRQAALQTLQNAVGNKAADSLYINEVKDGDNTRYFVGIKGDVGNFESLGSGAKDLGELVGAKQVVEFGLTDKDLPGNGAGQASYTYAPGEIGNANPRVLVNPGAVANASSFLSDTVFGGSFFGPGKIRDTTTDIAAFHEFGHVWKMWENINAAANGIIPGANGIDPRLNTSNEALRWENRMRIQVYGPLGPNNAQRIKHD